VLQLNASIAHTVVEGGEWRPKACVTGAPLTAGGMTRFTVRFAVGGYCNFAHVWPSVSRVADAVLDRAFAQLSLSQCDHAPLGD